MKKLLIVCIFPFFLAGCGRDASQLTVVTAIGVDGIPGAYQIDTEVIRLTDSDQNSQSVLLQSDGRTVSDGIDSLVSATGRSLYCNHAQVLIVGRNTAEADLAILLEEILRVNQYPLSLRVAVAKGTASELLQAKAVVSDLHSTELEDMLREGAAQCLTADMTVSSFYQDMRDEGIEGILPFLELREDHGQPICTLGGTLLFRDDTPVTVLNREDSATLMWMRGKSGGALMTDYGLLEVTYLDRKLEANADGAKLTLKLTLTAAGSEDNKAALVAEAEQLLEYRCRNLIARMQSLECDAVGFGQQLRRQHLLTWNALPQPWEQQFPNYPIQVDVTVETVIWGRIWREEDTLLSKEDLNGT